MTATIIESDTDLIHLFDWEFETPCDAVADNCSIKAEWSLRFPCCGAVFLYCDSHKTRLIEFIDQMRGAAICKECRASTPSSQFRSKLIVEKL